MIVVQIIVTPPRDPCSPVSASSPPPRLLVLPSRLFQVLRDAYRGVAARILEGAEGECVDAVDKALAREKDPFTVNEFLQVKTTSTSVFWPC